MLLVDTKPKQTKQMQQKNTHFEKTLLLTHTKKNEKQNTEREIKHARPYDKQTADIIINKIFSLIR